jgi:hypothetical protein
VGDDVVPEGDFIQKHLQLHEYFPEAETAILGHIQWPQDMPINTLMRHIDGIGAQQFSYHYLRDGNEYDFRHFYTANISLKRSFLFSTENWFDTNFPLAAFEDVELAYRLRNKGLRIIYSSAPVVNHYHYHTIWSFSLRQYKAGLMACILEEKHPGALKNNAWVLKKFRLPIHGLLEIRQKLGRKLRPAAQIELDALRIASFYEWQPNLFLDWLYLEILDYFWMKGLIQGSFRSDAASDLLIEWWANQRLQPKLDEFLKKARRVSIPTPN